LVAQPAVATAECRGGCAAAANVLHAVNTIAAGLGLGVDEEGAADRDTAA